MKKGKFELRWFRTKIWALVYVITIVLSIVTPAGPAYMLSLVLRTIAVIGFYWNLGSLASQIVNWFIKLERKEQVEFEFEKEGKLKSEDLKP